MQITSAHDLGAAVRSRRIALSLSQAELARRAGVSRPWLSHVETGKLLVEFGLLLRLFDSLGLALAVGEQPTGPSRLDAILEDYDRQ